MSLASTYKDGPGQSKIQAGTKLFDGLGWTQIVSAGSLLGLTTAATAVVSSGLVEKVSKTLKVKKRPVLHAAISGIIIGVLTILIENYLYQGTIACIISRNQGGKVYYQTDDEGATTAQPATTIPPGQDETDASATYEVNNSDLGFMQIWSRCGWQGTADP